MIEKPRRRVPGYGLILLMLICLLLAGSGQSVPFNSTASTDGSNADSQTPVAEAGISEPAASDNLELMLRSREETKPGSGIYQVVQRKESWNPHETAIIIADMWDRHWCRGSEQRVGEMAPRMNEVVDRARQKGVLIVHAPSGTLDFYEDSTQRERALQAPYSEPPFELEGWCYLDPEKEDELPIDDTDGGCDTGDEEGPPWPWTRQVSSIEIHEGDAISDDGNEIYNLFRQQGIRNLIVMGVHTNMCVLGRSFAIRQMVNLGINVALMRDMTDAMYNPGMPPYVTQPRGTELVVEHIETFWAPTLLSSDLTGQPAFRFAHDGRTHIAFVIAEDEYDAHLTLPQFAEEHLAGEGRFAFNYIQSDGPQIEGMSQIRDADLVVLYVRRKHPTAPQLEWLHGHLEAGKPLVALRTSSHAFETWTQFDPQVLGGNYSGHHGNRPPEDPPTRVQVKPEKASHPVAEGLPGEPFRVDSWLYRVRPLADDVVPLMCGWVGERSDVSDEEVEPITWIRKYGDNEARIFYTSLGHQRDFENPAFNRLLTNAIHWAAGIDGE